MKKTFKLIGIIALAAVIGLTMTTCDDGVFRRADKERRQEGPVGAAGIGSHSMKDENMRHVAAQKKLQCVPCYGRLARQLCWQSQPCALRAI